MIEIMGAEKLALWIIVLALVYGTTDFINHRAMKRARIDPANREFFDRYLPATLRDFAPQITTVITLILAGSWIWFSGHHGWFAICTLVGSLIGLGYEMHKAVSYWNISMGNGGSYQIWACNNWQIWQHLSRRVQCYELFQQWRHARPARRCQINKLLINAPV